MGLEQPGLHQVAGADEDERWETVEMSDGNGICDAEENQERHGAVSKADPHQYLVVVNERKACRLNNTAIRELATCWGQPQPESRNRLTVAHGP